MQNWIARQFLDGLALCPGRYLLCDPVSGATVETRTFAFKPGNVIEVGTFLNRGYFQQIEDALAEYGSQETWNFLRKVDGRGMERVISANKTLSQMEARVINAIEGTGGISSRIGQAEKDLTLYAPKMGAVFTNPKAAVSPPAGDVSARIATTEQVRAFVAQYPFPPKDVKNFGAFAGDNQVEIRWRDPEDFVYDGQSLALWKGTKVVYRTDRYPVNETDGTVLADNTLRNYYQTQGVLMLKLQAGSSYYISAFPYGTCVNRANSERAYAVAGGLVAINSLSTARLDLAAATDGNGNVLFGGGWDGSGYTRSSVVERFDVNGNKMILPQLSQARRGLAAATDGNGNVLFGGGDGVSSATYSNVEKYTTSGNLIILADLAKARFDLAAASNGNGEVLFGGGEAWNNGRYSTVEKYDKNGTRADLPSLSKARSGLKAYKNGLGHVLFAGGINDSSIADATAEKYDRNGVKSVLSNLSAARYALATAMDGRGNVLFAGGRDVPGNAKNTVDRYDTNGVRSSLTALSIARYALAAAMDGNGNVLFAGGTLGYGVGTYYAAVDKYDKNGTRSSILNLSVARSGLSASTDGKGNVLFGGGYSGDYSPRSNVDKYWRSI